MKLSLKKYFKIVFIINISILILLIFSIYNLNSTNEKLRILNHNKLSMIIKAKELKTSSENLIYFSRLYVITKNKKYKENYLKILSTRNGIYPKQENYHGIYWKLSDKIKKELHPIKNNFSAINNFNKFPFSKKELENFNISLSKSKELVEIDLKSFKILENNLNKKNKLAGNINSTIKSLFNKDYLIENQKNQKMAINMLFDKHYEKLISDIMLPIDKSLISTTNRTSKLTILYNNRLTFYNYVLTSLVIAYIIFFIGMYISARKKILIQITNLSKSIKAYKRGKKEVEEHKYYNDEIGLAAKQFFLMKEKLNKEYKEMEFKINIDKLTGTFNRTFFNKKIQEQISSSQASYIPFYLIMFDIDDFKKINDTYGHDSGDKILINLVNIIYKSIRKTDLLFRIGGEEFIIILDNSNSKVAYNIAEKIRHIIATELNIIKNKTVTISVGLTSFKHNDTDATIYKRVDSLLYASKRTGKNKITTDLKL